MMRFASFLIWALLSATLAAGAAVLSDVIVAQIENGYAISDWLTEFGIYVVGWPLAVYLVFASMTTPFIAFAAHILYRLNPRASRLQLGIVVGVTGGILFQLLVVSLYRPYFLPATSWWLYGLVLGVLWATLGFQLIQTDGPLRSKAHRAGAEHF